MKRILIAGILAVLIHALLFGIDFSFFKDNINKGLKSHVITMSLDYQQKKKAKKPSPKPIQPQKKIASPKKLRIPDKSDKIIPLKTESPGDKKPEIIGKTVNIDDSLDLKNNTLGRKFNEKAEKNSEIQSNILPIIEARPMYIDNTPPIYPTIARRRGYEGTVVLEVLVDKNGIVGDLGVFTSSGYEVLDSAAIASVKKWLFEPGLIGNEKREMWVRVPIRFKLK